MINLTKDSVVFQQPFRHLEVSGVLDREAACQLRRNFPRSLDVTVRKSGTDKTYVVSNRRLLGVDGTRHIKSACWNRFLDAVASEDYRTYLSEISGVSLRGTLVEVDVNAYAAGGYMSAHTDRPEKILSHIIYLTPHWNEDWGGQLTLLDGMEGCVVRSVTPQWPVSVVLPRSDRSWHSVAAVGQSPRRRLTIQITFWSREPPPVATGRIRMGALGRGDSAG